MKARLYEYSQKLIRNNRHGGKVKSTSFSDDLYNNYQFGQQKYGELYFTDLDINNLIGLVKDEIAVDLFIDPYPCKKSRQENSQTHRNEKDNSYAISKHFVLVNSLNYFCFNHNKIAKHPINALGLSLNSQEILTVEHPYIVIVENLTVMASLAELRLPESLLNALWLYRGDLKPGQQTGSAYEFFRRFEHHRLICFSDFDPKGIEIAITSGAKYWLTLVDDENINMPLEGIEQEWISQKNSINYLLNDSLTMSNKCRQAFSTMKLYRKTLKQEHMLKHKLVLDIFEI